MDFRGKLILAPLAGVTDTTFRRLCRENGADIVVTEMVSAKGLLCDPDRSGACLAYDEAGRPGGAPVGRVPGGGPGSAILANPRLAGEIAREAVRAAGIPVTVKIRSGFGNGKETYLAVAEELFAAGAAAGALAPRPRGQRFAGGAAWTH